MRAPVSSIMRFNCCMAILRNPSRGVMSNTPSTSRNKIFIVAVICGNLAGIQTQLQLVQWIVVLCNETVLKRRGQLSQFILGKISAQKKIRRNFILPLFVTLSIILWSFTHQDYLFCIFKIYYFELWFETESRKTSSV